MTSARPSISEAAEPLSMVCRTCQDMLHFRKGHRPRVYTLFELKFNHHRTRANLLKSARDQACYMCRVICDRLGVDFTKDTDDGGENGRDASHFLWASLRRVKYYKPALRLDFRINNDSQQRGIPVASFLLVKDDSDVKVRLRPMSETTDNDKVFKLAQRWIDACESSHAACRKFQPAFYPSRLIDVMPDSTNKNPRALVKIVSSKSAEGRATPQPAFAGRYVTLSHRWGLKPFIRLTQTDLPDYQEGIHFNKFPLTFQHVILLVRALGIRWIWIDALCIIQDSKQDWLEESAVMHKIYANSYCNISATAAQDSSKGLFRSRDCRRDWIQSVTVNVKDLLPGVEDWIHCTVVDLSFWERSVDRAPVNLRSWVLQERLLAPRVLHWCEDQIAFECQCMILAECYPDGVPHLSILQGELVEGLCFKQIDPGAGKHLRRIRLQKEYPTLHRGTLSQMVDGVEARWHYYEVWKRIVESYSKLELYKAEDRLIALSGIARNMGKLMESAGIPDKYVAGLWKEGLPSQLLWYVNEFETGEPQPLEDNRPKDRQGRPLEYRAPTFSWASVETSRGISFAELTGEQAKVSVSVVRLLYLTRDKFGLLTDGYILLKGILRRIVLIDNSSRADPSRTPKVAVEDDDDKNEDHGVSDFVEEATSPEHSSSWHNRNHVWSLSTTVPIILQVLYTTYQLIYNVWPIRSRPKTPITVTAEPLPPLVPEPPPIHRPTTPDTVRTVNRWSWRLTKLGIPQGSEYSNVYLDSPASQPSIFGADADVFIIPALLTQSSLICLMVQATSGDYGIRYKRVGLTIIKAVHGDAINDIITPPTKNENEKGKYYWGPEGQQSGETDICII